MDVAHVPLPVSNTPPSAKLALTGCNLKMLFSVPRKGCYVETIRKPAPDFKTDSPSARMFTTKHFALEVMQYNNSKAVFR